jgi:predicted aspartyl protease
MARAKAAYVPPTPERLREVLGSFRYASSSEQGLRDEIARALATRGIRFDRAVQVKGGRADFLVDGTAVVVALTGSPAEALGGVATSPQVAAVLLVTRRGPVPSSFPAKIGRKPLLVMAVGGA